jgi:hypothetical protein
MHLGSRITSTAAVVLASSALGCVPALASGPASVTVRVEGSTQTLVGPTQVLTNNQLVSGDGKPEDSCPGYSALGALSLATRGNWMGTWYGGSINNGKFEGFGYSIETIAGESHAFGSGSYWDFWFNHSFSLKGLCEAEGENGSEVLLFPCAEPGNNCPSPLAIEAPAVAPVGEVSVRVIRYSESGVGSPVAGALVSGGAEPKSTGPDGRAVLTLASAGEVRLQASAPEAVRDEVDVCVHNGDDGTCGTSAPAPTTTTTSTSTTKTASGGVLGAGPGGPYKGPYALVASVTSVRDGHTYVRAVAPRLLSGTILSHSAVSSVSLELRREFRGRCSSYEALRGRFVHARCGSGRTFTASSGASFSYLLPKRLGPGRYVLDVEALDVAGNHTTLARGSSRIVFYVR